MVKFYLFIFILPLLLELHFLCTPKLLSDISCTRPRDWIIHLRNLGNYVNFFFKFVVLSMTLSFIYLVNSLIQLKSHNSCSTINRRFHYLFCTYHDMYIWIHRRKPLIYGKGNENEGVLVKPVTQLKTNFNEALWLFNINCFY